MHVQKVWFEDAWELTYQSIPKTPRSEILLSKFLFCYFFWEKPLDVWSIFSKFSKRNRKTDCSFEFTGVGDISTVSAIKICHPPLHQGKWALQVDFGALWGGRGRRMSHLKFFKHYRVGDLLRISRGSQGQIVSNFGLTKGRGDGIFKILGVQKWNVFWV